MAKKMYQGKSAFAPLINHALADNSVQKKQAETEAELLDSIIKEKRAKINQIKVETQKVVNEYGADLLKKYKDSTTLFEQNYWKDAIEANKSLRPKD